MSIFSNKSSDLSVYVNALKDVILEKGLKLHFTTEASNISLSSCLLRLHHTSLLYKPLNCDSADLSAPTVSLLHFHVSSVLILPACSPIIHPSPQVNPKSNDNDFTPKWQNLLPLQDLMFKLWSAL